MTNESFEVINLVGRCNSRSKMAENLISISSADRVVLNHFIADKIRVTGFNNLELRRSSLTGELYICFMAQGSPNSVKLQNGNHTLSVVNKHFSRIVREYVQAGHGVVRVRISSNLSHSSDMLTYRILR